ncbi:MAG: hypothetical protein COT85_06380 [Chlamydiae bacterium CG10_big_fil_rev_8_21_14_0_10_42_34]|nr:MAG: hypothetical protein COT85_06380 [Chlamydiae bacterium CG10_big_fil_rev_8_21_14_0_10_42_34]
MRFILFLSLVAASLFADFSKTVYPLSLEPIDVVIPCHKKDCGSLERCVKAIRKYGLNIGRVIVVSSEPLTMNAEWFDENNFPFSKDDLLREIYRGKEEKMHRGLCRIGWIYQQFLKLYAFSVIPNISSNILILDADTIFLKPTAFLSSSGEPFFNPGKEYYPPYFDHAQRLLPGFRKVFPKHSGICHHMLFQRPILEDLFDQISRVHGIKPWKAIARCIDYKEVKRSCLSEYEIYFNFVFMRTDQAHLRKLKWKNIESLDQVKDYKKKGYDYVSCHVY